MEQRGGVMAERMAKLGWGNAELGGGKLNVWQDFVKPNLGLGLSE